MLLGLVLHHPGLFSSDEHVAADWPIDPFRPGFSLGNHRAEVAIPSLCAHAPVVQVRVPWRRRPSPHLNRTTVMCATPPLCDGCNVTVLPNCNLVARSTLETGVVNLEPAGHQLIHIYYLPYSFTGLE